MQKTNKHKIVIIGCGNVAWHLAKQLTGLKKYELFVYNHQANSLLNDFKTKLKCLVTPNLNMIITDADFYFICVADKNISSVAKKIKIKNTNAIVVHTSGSAKINELGEKSNTAVFYPLQTFSKQDEVNWKEIPIIIEAEKRTTLHEVTDLAMQLSSTIIYAKEKERLTLHLAAVLANNFTNALYVVADEMLHSVWEKQGINLILPLIKQTTNKLERMRPLQAQTGPAKRKDNIVMKKHLKMLSGNKDIQNIYKQLSALIVKQQTKHA